MTTDKQKQSRGDAEARRKAENDVNTAAAGVAAMNGWINFNAIHINDGVVPA